MLKNNIELDVKIKCIEQNKPQSKIAEALVCWQHPELGLIPPNLPPVGGADPAQQTPK